MFSGTNDMSTRIATVSFWKKKKYNTDRAKNHKSGTRREHAQMIHIHHANRIFFCSFLA